MVSPRDDVPAREVTAAWQQALAEVEESPALAGVVARRGTALFRRFRLWYARLQGLGRGAQRRWRRRLGVGLAGAALLLALTGGPGLGAPANTITVSGACTLAKAIDNANNTTDGMANADCAAGNPAGADTISLTADVSLTDVNNTTYGPTGLPVVTSPITIEGDGHTISRDVSASSAFRLLAVGSGGDLTLNSATVSGGYASAGPNISSSGAGILVASASLAVMHSTISGNSSFFSGGGIGSYFATTSVQYSTISGNFSLFGGGIYNFGGTTSLQHSTISDNSGYLGGGIFNYYASLAATNSYFYDNIAGAPTSGIQAGGGIFNNEGSVSVASSTFSGNTAYYSGGAISVFGGSVGISNSTLNDNTADHGGGVNVFIGEVTISGSTVSSNLSSYGGGVYASGSTASITPVISPFRGHLMPDDASLSGSATVSIINSTLSGNTADAGGGIYAKSATVAVMTSTLSGNSAIVGGGIYATRHRRWR